MATPLYIDVETHYEPDGAYSLKKMPTVQYVRDGRFELLGAALAAPGFIRPGWYLPQEMHAAIARLPWPDVETIAHNCAFDALVLNERIRPDQAPPTRYACTMLHARYAIAQGVLPATYNTRLAQFSTKKGDTAAAVAAGGDALRAYAEQDLLDLVNLHKWLEANCPLPELESDLIDLHVRMAVEPRLVTDGDALKAAANKAPPAAAVAIRKKKTFIAALAHYGVEPGYKISPRTGKETEAFAKDDGFMRKLGNHADPRVRALHSLRVKGGSNITRTRAQRILDMGDPLPIPLLYYGAHTGRSSGQGAVNPQNLPRGGVLRKAIIAPLGHKLVIIDSAQVEVRVLAWLAGEETLLDVFRNGQDPYRAFGARLYNCEAAAVTDEQRRISKAAVLALGFGQGAGGFVAYCERSGVSVTPQQAQAAVDRYRSSYPRIVAYWATLQREVEIDGEILLPSGRKLTYPDRSRDGRDAHYLRHQIFSKQRKGQRDKIKLWPGFVTENVTQAAARDVVLWQTIKLSRAYPVALSVHDEAVLCVPTDEADDALQCALHCFAEPPAWAGTLPVAGEGIISDNYGEKP